MKYIIRYLAITLIILSAGLTTSRHLSAQTFYQSRVYIGARGGVSMGKMDFSPSVLQKFTPGPQFFVSMRYQEEKIFGLLAELGVVTRGWAEDFEESPLNYKRHLTYITLPVMTHINFGSKRFKCFVNLGPQFSYLLSESTDANFDFTNIAGVENFPDKPRMTEQLTMPVKNKFDYGIALGIGAEYLVTPRHSVLLEARFYYGLGNIYPSAKKDIFSASRNMSLEFSAGYFFRIK